MGNEDPNVNDPPADPPVADPPADPPQEPTEVEALKTEMEALKAQYEAEKKANAEILSKEQLEKEELVKAKTELEARDKANEDRERKALVKKIEKYDKEYPNKEGDLETIRRDLYFLEKVSKQFEQVNVGGPDFMEADSLGLGDEDKMFEEGKDLELKLFHRNEFSKPPSTVFSNEDK